MPNYVPHVYLPTIQYLPSERRAFVDNLTGAPLIEAYNGVLAQRLPQTSSTSTAILMKLMFDTRVAGVKSPKSDINALILDYLTKEGYPNAAANFSKEANLRPQQDDASVRARQQIQNYIHRGQIQDATEAVNELDPEILDKNQTLQFSLLRLQLIELIRACNGGDPTPALQFATEQLGPRANQNQDFLDMLEQTMSLVFFSPENVPPELKKLLEPDLRRVVADDVNKAILGHQSQRREATIRHFVRMRAWAEDVARERSIKRDNKGELPERISLGLHEDSAEPDDRVAENGHDLMITT